MKFNEKLIELRKKRGLSQEELGYQFNVTRQTISKWELGQTTPEMDKLVEISKFFDVTVDELINEQEININEDVTNENVVIEDKKVIEKSDNKRKIVVIIAVIVLLLVILGGSFVSSIFKTVNNTFDTLGNVNEQVEQQTEGVFGIFNKILNLLNRELDKQLENTDDIQNDFNQIQEEINNQEENTGKFEEIFNQAQNKIEISSFNGTFELHEGMIKGVEAKTLLSEVIANNRKENKIMTVVFENQNTTDVEQIKSIREKIDDFADYEAYFGYDEQGYINQVNIEK